MVHYRRRVFGLVAAVEVRINAPFASSASVALRALRAISGPLNASPVERLPPSPPVRRILEEFAPPSASTWKGKPPPVGPAPPVAASWPD